MTQHARRRRLVVVGNGMAGARLVEDVLRRGGGAQFEITVCGDEPRGNYNRILLSGVLAGSHDPLDIYLNPVAWYAEHGVRLRAGVRVERIDREARVVRAAGGIEEPYDVLVLATGSAPFIPPIDGLRTDAGRLRDGAFVFRTLDDCDRMTAWARRSSRAVVIGGGLLGLEAARGLMNLGPEVHVVHLMPHLMEVQLDPAAGAILARTLRGLGVTIHLERATAGVTGDDAVSGLRFDDGASLDCDMLVVATGIRPNVALAHEAGLAVERGILVGDDLSCPDDPAIFAVGECAQHRGQVYGLVGPLWEQTAVLAQRLTQRRPEAVYEGSCVSTKLKVMGVDLVVMGEKEPADDNDEVVTYVEPSRGVYKKLVIREGRLAGAILLGDSAVAPILQQAFDRGMLLPDARADLLFPGSGAAAAPLSVDDLPGDAQLCNCNGVSKGHIVAAVRAGCHGLASVSAATRAGTGCGSCKDLVRQVIEASLADRAAGKPTLASLAKGETAA